MKLLILALLMTVSYQQTVCSQASCSKYNCTYFYENCFNENNTECKAYGENSLTECEIGSMQDMLSGIIGEKAFNSDAALTPEIECLANKKDNEDFKKYTECLVSCLYFVPQENSYLGLQVGMIGNTLEEYTTCIADEECLDNIQQIEFSPNCEKCSFLPENPFNWNLPLTEKDACCFRNCMSSNNTDNELLQIFFDKNIDFVNAVQFEEDWVDEEEEDNGHKKFFEILIAFIMKIFTYLFK